MKWQSGIDNFITYSIEGNHLHTHINDRERQHNNIHDIFAAHVAQRQTKFCEVLYSGGLDSELVLSSLHSQGIPVKALTMELSLGNTIINAHDLYYADKFCKAYGIEQNIIRLDLKKFFDNGDHIPYCVPYKITLANVATQLWLLEQASGFPIIGGDWPWLQTHKSLTFSPYRLDFVVGELFMLDRGIHGINNMISYSFDSCAKLIDTQAKTGMGSGWMNQSLNKYRMYKLLGINLEPRVKAYGFDLLNYDTTYVNLKEITDDLISRTGMNTASISWEKMLGGFLNIPPGTNDKFD